MKTQSTVFTSQWFRPATDSGSLLIETKGAYPSIVTNVQGTIAVVLSEPTQWRNIQPFAKQNIGPQLAGIFHLNINDLPIGKNTFPVKATKAGWERVKKEIRTLCPKVKRILFMTDTKALRVVLPGLTGDIDNAHGTLFKVDEWIVVPTWTIDNIELLHVRPWMMRDIQRCLHLTRPEQPLEYTTFLPNNLNGEIVIDLETSGLDFNKDFITVLGVQWSDKDRAYIKGDDIPKCIDYITQQLNNGSITDVIGANFQYDMGFLGQEFRDAAYGRVRCTFIRAKARGELVCGLKHLASVYTARPGNYAWHEPGTTHTFSDPAYVCEDLDTTWRLYHLKGWSVTTPVVELMEKAIVMASEQSTEGTYIDKDALGTILEETQDVLESLEGELLQEYGCLPGQTQELSQELVRRGYPLSKKTQTGKDALTAEVLEELGLVDILEYRHLQKLNSAFIGKLESLMRKDCTVPHHQTMLGADTGRSTMRDFNWQQLPRKGPGKKLVVSRWPGGKIAQVDLSQAELRIACYESNDHKMARWLMSADAHRVNASRAFEVAFVDVTEDQRNSAKTVIFRLIYGGSAITDGQKRVEVYVRQEFVDLFRKLDGDGKRAMADKAITDAYGKCRNLLAVYDYRGKWAVKRAGINSPVQGIASHCAIFLTLTVWEILKRGYYQSLVLFGVHDSLVVDVCLGEEEVVTNAIKQAFKELRNFTSRYELSSILPLQGELQFGDSWADTKSGEKIICSSLGD